MPRRLSRHPRITVTADPALLVQLMTAMKAAKTSKTLRSHDMGKVHALIVQLLEANPPQVRLDFSAPAPDPIGDLPQNREHSDSGQ